jgi:hypothetical protein
VRWRTLLGLLACGCAGSPIRTTIAVANSAAGEPGIYQLSTLRLPEELRWPVELPGVVGDCEPVATWLSAHDGLVAILVKGPFGAREDWTPLLDALRYVPLKGLFELRWDARDEADGNMAVLAASVNRLLRCAPHPNMGVLVVGHGAGAVLSDAAAAWFTVPSDRPGMVVEVLELVPDDATDLDALFPNESVHPAASLGVEVTRVHATLAEAAAHLRSGDVPNWSRGAAR